jgi:hypothetical protein
MNTLKLLIPILLLFTTCSDDIESISIQREGSLTFRVEGYNDVWKSNLINLYQGPSIVKVFPGTPDKSILFKRYFIVFEGDKPGGGTFELTVAIDFSDEVSMRYAYTTDYSQLNGGLSQISLILTENGSSKISLAELCDNTASVANFKILRQDLTEKLIAGTLEADLCLQSSPETRFVIYNAEFKDIKYKK